MINARSEDYAQKNREKFDIVTARAVAPLKHLLEYGIPLLKVNGNFIAMKANVENEEQNIENYLKFLESFFLFTDLEIFNGKGLKFIQYDIDYLATPSYARTSIVMTLLGEYGFTFEEILNNNALSKRKLIKIEDVSVMKSGSDMASLEKRVMAIPELTDYYTELLSEICFDNLVRLAAKHIFDLKKDCIKLVYKLSKIKTK